MGAGLDELIESLVTDIAFSGVRGCSVSNLLVAIDSLYKSSERGDEPQQTTNRQDLAVASKVWKWLADRSDVSIGVNREFNHLSLEQALALPEEGEPPSSGAAGEASNKTSHPGPSPRTSKGQTSTARPRLHVSEERQWRTIAGHGPDLKRVPLFEWRALVDIASVKEKGILQGDLVRLTGQDKRSLPTRTDALARKGYVIKQPIVLRGGKSSKLWLAQFSEYAKEHQEREGLDYDRLDLSKAALTSDLQPVPFCHKWNGETIDYLALAQAFVVIVKAWALIRYCDARAKLGVEERVRQMRALAKTCRWLTNIGALSFVGAKFAGSNRLFKDCVKYIRDPSPAEWSHFRATPKARMVVPSGRIGKRGEASRAVHASQLGGSRGKAAGKRSHEAKFRGDPISHTNAIPPPWKPQKPVPNTAFEIIKRAGSQGTSNAAICRQTLGHNFRRLTAAMAGSISMPTNSQPPHLKHLSSSSQLSRIGRTLTYTFYANTEIGETGLDEQPAQASNRDTSTMVSTSTANGTAANHPFNDFSPPDLSRFSAYPGLPLKEIAQNQRPNRVVSTTSKRKRRRREELDDQPSAKIPRRLGRPPKKSPIDATPSAPAEEHRGPETDDAPSTTQPATTDQQSPLGPPPRPPGVYRGLPNSLDPVTKRKGRRPRSLVIIFRSDKLKDPSFLAAPSASPEVDVANNSSSEAATTKALPTSRSVHVEHVNSADTTATPGTVSEPLHVESKKSKAGKNGAFWCEKCGNSWKNSNGLEYHLTKSRTACNPDFVPPSTELINQRKRKPAQRKALERASVPHGASDELGQTRQTLTPREQKESRFGEERRSLASRSQKPSAISSPSDESTAVDAHYQPPRGSIILKDLEVYDATDHQRFLRQPKFVVNSELSAHHEIMPTRDTQQPPMHDKLSSNTTKTASGEVLDSDVHNLGKQENPFDRSPNTGTEQPESLIKDQTFSTITQNSTIEQAGISQGNLRITTSIGRPRIRKPLPTIPSEKPKDPSPPIPTLTTRPTTAQKASSPEVHPEPLFNNVSAQPSIHKPLAFFARPIRPNASFGARRRSRTMQIIEYLLEQNEGVFPGLRSVFMAVISVWAREFRDLAPPDRRICQNTVNQMERDGILKQMHFFFFDDEAKMQECVVLAKADTKNGRTVDTSNDPRVIAVKEKMREMFPEAYVPDAFSLSPDEAKLFDELASQGKEHSQPRNLKVPKDLRKVQDIETLRYENSVMDDISLHRNNNAKRQVDEVHVESQPPSKRARIDIGHLDLLGRNRKPRRRPDKHEMWDSGKLAVYIWSQRQKPSAMWEQNRSCLQDPTTGTWSWTPDTDPSELGSITTILSSVKSARQIDASLKRKGRKRLAGTDPIAGARRKYQRASQHSEFPIVTGGLRVPHGDQYDVSSTQIPGAAAISLASYSLTSDEETEDMYENSSDISDHESVISSTSSMEFAPEEILGDVDFRGSLLETQDATNATPIRPMQSSLQLSRENPPRDVQDILKTARDVYSFKRWADPAYGEFLRNIKTIKRWEQSADGFSVLTHGTTAPDFVYISLTPDDGTVNLKPTNLEWLGSNQFTPDNVPDEIKNASLADEEYGLSHLVTESRKMGKQRINKSESNPAGHRETNNGGQKLKYGSRRAFSRVHATLPQSSMSPAKSEAFIEYKTRDLTIIPKQPRGRFNKPTAHDDKLGSKREDELIAACVVFRTLLGGLDRSLDIGLLLKHYPGMSLSALKKFWPRISRERKSYVQALTAKFQSAFLMAYESGKLPPLDYDDIENYDWPKVILWATQLETHEDVDLPESRDTLHQKYLVEDVANETVDWRETWFATTSTYNRIEAVASETMSIPLPPKHQQDKTVLERARTWVRSICCTSLKGVNVTDKLVPKLLELGNGDAAETNQILNKVVARLNREKIITRTKGKDLGGNFRINGMFSKQLEKMACTPKFRQAIAFKAQLDEVFRLTEEYILPYASDDGSIMAALNLQAHGRIRIDTVEMPNIPFGFEPGNYEGRTFPKSYYHFKVRIVPTETYLFNDDVALLKQAQRMEPPTEGPGGKIPIWVDFFGNVNATRWADYVSMIAFTLAIKGPIAPKMCVTLLKPMVDEFEVQLIVDWLDKLGLIQQAVHGCGVTAAEWWWLVAGHVVQASDQITGENRALE